MHVILSLFFVRSGLVEPNGPYVNVAGGVGYYWSSSPLSNGTYAYYLAITPAGSGTTVAPSNGNYRYAGFSLRCLAR